MIVPEPISREARSRADDALCRLLAPHIQGLRRQVQRAIPDRLRATICADDVLQQVWIAAHHAFPTFQATGPHALDRWLMTIANAKLADLLRKARGIRHGDDRRLVRDAQGKFTSCSNLFDRLQSPQKTPSRVVHAAEAAHLVLIALQRLNPARRNAIELFYIRGLSEPEIAVEMGRSRAAVNSLLCSGRRQLRRILGRASKYFSDARDDEYAAGG